MRRWPPARSTAEHRGSVSRACEARVRLPLPRGRTLGGRGGDRLSFSVPELGFSCLSDVVHARHAKVGRGGAGCQSLAWQELQLTSGARTLVRRRLNAETSP